MRWFPVVRIFVLLFIGLTAFAANAQNVERCGIIFFHQEGSGLRIVGIGSDTARKQAGTFLRLKNYTQRRVVGFRLAFVVAGDSRLQPETKVGPKIVKRSEFIESAIDPGQLYDVYNTGPRFDEFLPWLKEGGVRFGILRAGISRVVYADGSEQNFDLLKDEQATRSTAPPDTGGHPNPLPKGTSSGNSSLPKLVLARATPALRACTFRGTAITAVGAGAYLYADSESEALPLSFDSRTAPPAKPSPSGCNYMFCNLQCLDWPNCSIMGMTCQPSAYDCADGAQCQTFLCMY